MRRDTACNPQPAGSMLRSHTAERLPSAPRVMAGRMKLLIFVCLGMIQLFQTINLEALSSPILICGQLMGDDRPASCKVWYLRSGYYMKVSSMPLFWRLL